MTPEFAAAQVYTDFSGFESLRAQAREKSPQVLREVARQFEGLMLQMMLKSMRQAGLDEGILDSDKVRYARDMHDQQLALTLSQRGDLGLADVLVRQLGGDSASSAPASGLVPEDYRAMAIRSQQAADPGSVPAATNIDSIPAVDPVDDEASIRHHSPEDFVKAVWPHAERAAARLGTSAEVLVAQAALETGWGRSIIQNENAGSSHNLFGIKADRRWDGDRVAVSTLEYRDGMARRETAEFRSYGTYEAAFEDYVDFIRDSSRYHSALSVAGDPAAYARALQDAGYATDPEYAAKIERIMAGDTLGSALAALGSSERPAT